MTTSTGSMRDFVIQGGSPTPTGSEPNPPANFANEDLQQLAFTGTYQLAMANEGIPDTNEIAILHDARSERCDTRIWLHALRPVADRRQHGQPDDQNSAHIQRFSATYQPSR